ncbi:MAG: HD domain-containing protein [Nitrospirae bacterium]|nr:HD domain-containing protein [Nitrospirota bacterium]
MPRQYKNIHKRLIITLLISWVVISIIIGSGVLFFELKKVDNHCKRHAQHEAVRLEERYSRYFTADKELDKEIITENITNYLLKSNFIYLELYNNNRQSILVIQNGLEPKVQEEIEKTEHFDYLTSIVDYRRLYFESNLYLQTFAPIKKDNNIIGYFEGIYKVDTETIRDIKEDILWSLSLVIIITLSTTIVLYPIIISLNKDLIKLSGDLSQANIGMLEVLGNAISKRDSDTNIHNYRVTLLALSIGEKIGLNQDQIRGLIKGSFLHDIGKIGISDNILLKPDRLTSEEFDAMKTHVKHGVDIISKYPWLADAVEVVECHHERYDGAGYLSGFRGKEVPINARIFAISDVFDALTSKRPYKEPYSYEKTMEILVGSEGTHFDPVILDTFKKLSLSLYKEITLASNAYLMNELQKRIRKYFSDIYQR